MARRIGKISRIQGFTLVEVLFAVAILSVIFLANLTLLQSHRIQSRKAMDQAIMNDFAIHYLDLARSMNFDEIAGGAPINKLFDGTNGSPNIRLPADASWYSLWTTDFRTFHPDLSWLNGRNPEYRVALVTQMNGTTPRAKAITLSMRWDPPLKRGAAKVTMDVTTVVYPEFN